MLTGNGSHHSAIIQLYNITCQSYASTYMYVAHYGAINSTVCFYWVCSRSGRLTRISNFGIIKTHCVGTFATA